MPDSRQFLPSEIEGKRIMLCSGCGKAVGYAPVYFKQGVTCARLRCQVRRQPSATESRDRVITTIFKRQNMSIRLLARHAGYSPHTISSILNQRLFLPPEYGRGKRPEGM